MQVHLDCHALEMPIGQWSALIMFRVRSFLLMDRACFVLAFRSAVGIARQRHRCSNNTTLFGTVVCTAISDAIVRQFIKPFLIVPPNLLFTFWRSRYFKRPNVSGTTDRQDTGRRVSNGY